MRVFSLFVAAIFFLVLGLGLGYGLGASFDPSLTVYNHAKPGEKFLVLRLGQPMYGPKP